MKTATRNIKFLIPAEIEKICTGIERETSRGRRDYALLRMLFSTGLRISEALRITRKEYADMKEHKKNDLVITGKGGYQRIVFFSPPARTAIDEYLSLRQDDKPLLFPITVRCAQLMVKERAREAGITKRITPHMFRHSLATDLLNRGVDLRVVQEFLGHRSISSTEVYTHVASAKLRETHAKLYR